MPDPGWMEQLRWLICQLYQAWGGNCNELGVDAPAWVTTLENTYQASGQPPFHDEEARSQFEVTLSELELHLFQPDNTLTPDDTARLHILIGALRTGPSGE